MGARDKCLALDSDLVVVNSFDENKHIYDLANIDQVDVWLGISENVIRYFYLPKIYSTWDVQSRLKGQLLDKYPLIARKS